MKGEFGTVLSHRMIPVNTGYSRDMVVLDYASGIYVLDYYGLFPVWFTSRRTWSAWAAYPGAGFGKEPHVPVPLLNGCYSRLPLQVGVFALTMV